MIHKKRAPTFSRQHFLNITNLIPGPVFKSHCMYSKYTDLPQLTYVSKDRLLGKFVCKQHCMSS